MNSLDIYKEEKKKPERIPSIEEHFMTLKMNTVNETYKDIGL